jgi:phosphoglycerol transferase
MLIESHRRTIVVCIALTASLLWLLLHSLGLYPRVFADEYLYSVYSRLMSFDQSAIPNFLYLAIYRLTNTCGQGFLDCARVLNAVAYVASVPFVYMVARRSCSTVVSAFIGAFVVFGAFNTYVVYFMPEAMYFLAFWIAAWYLLSIDAIGRNSRWLVAGALFGVASLIKPHALFLIPSLVVYASYQAWQTGRTWARAGVQSALIVAAMLGVKFAIGFAIAGRAGLTFFGPLYSRVAEAGPAWAHAMELVGNAGYVAWGHVMAIALLYGVGVLALGASIARIALRRSISPEHARLAVFSVVVLGALVPVAALFTASVANSQPWEILGHIHMRYYNFALPLLLIAAGSEGVARWNRGWRLVVPAAVLILIAIMLYARKHGLALYVTSLVDCPELYTWMGSKAQARWLAALSMLALALWAWRPVVGSRAFIFGYMPVVVVWTSITAINGLSPGRMPDVYDSAGIYARDHLDQASRARLVVVGSEMTGVFRTIFHVDSEGARYRQLAEGSNIPKGLLDGFDWALVVGRHAFDDPYLAPASHDRFSLVRLDPNVTLSFKRDQWPGVIRESKGLSFAEGWGTWSEGKLLILRFAQPLPERFTVTMAAKAFGRNAGKPFVLSIGQATIPFVLYSSVENRSFLIDNPTRSDELRIAVPDPTTAVEAGLNKTDKRPIGIGLVSLQISVDTSTERR